jgi:competence protein ComEA
MIRMMTMMLLVCGLAAAPALAQDPPAATKKTTAAAGALVNLNTASASQLESLPGIGKSTAERIVEYRQKNGGFKKVEDLMNVRGIGEKSFLKMKPLITVAAAKS